MLLSEKLNLNKSQYELDFVDIDLYGDIPLFINSNLIRNYDLEHRMKMADTMDSFFTFLLNALVNDLDDIAKDLCLHLSEINETHLGLSRGKSQGKGVGPKNAIKIFKYLKESDAIKKGVLENIEDLRLFIKKFDKDMLSDMITNILKKQLLDYTIEQCNLLNIQLTPNIPSGYYWDNENYKWTQKYMDRLVIEGKPIVLIPKRIVNYSDDYTSQKYKQHFVLNFLQEDNIKNQTSLVQLRKDETPYVTKKDIIVYEPKMDKNYLVNFKLKHSEVLKDFKKENLKNAKVMALY